MDVTNPGLTSVAGEVYGNPDPNGGQARWTPRELDLLTDPADAGYPPAANGVDASTFPTPDEVFITQLLSLPPVSVVPVPPAPNFNVADQCLGQGSMLPVDPANLSAGYQFVETADYIVVGPAESFQTNATELDLVEVTITAVLDADLLPTPAGPTTTRYYLVLAPPSLTSYPVSMLGRLIEFADDTLTVSDQGASRAITNYGSNFVVINREDPAESNGGIPLMVTPQAGDVFLLDVNRQGSEQVNTIGGSIDVTIFPPPPVNIPLPGQALGNQGTIDISTGTQPGAPTIESGVPAPTAINVSVPDQSAVIGLPQNVYT